jgi:hypothetical protein
VNWAWRMFRDIPQLTKSLFMDLRWWEMPFLLLIAITISFVFLSLAIILLIVSFLRGVGDL